MEKLLNDSATNTADEPTPRVISGPAAEPIELSEQSERALWKWIAPVVGAVAVLAVVARRLRQ